MRTGDFADFAIFVAIAEAGSLRAAAARLDLQPSTVSHGLRALEERLGVRLFHRTTRSVALTEAGQALLAQVAPALAALEAAEEVVNDFRAHPAGRVRLSVPRGIASCVLLPQLRAFMERCPEVQLDIAADNGFVDIVSAGFDAGVRLGGSVARDMVAVRITPPVQAVIVAAPEYLARHAAPQTPQDLTQHRCIGFRQLGGGTRYRWEFARDGAAFERAVASALVLDDPELMLDAAARGLGLTYALDVFCRDYLADGRLRPLLEDWLPHYDGFFLYYPNRQPSAALRALCEVLRVSD